MRDTITTFDEKTFTQGEDCPGVMILMRGLPSCGKSYTSKKLVGEDGIRIEFDEFFYTQVGDDPTRYNWSKDFLAQARKWNFQRIRDAVDARFLRIVLDSDNSNCDYTRQFVGYAMDRGYCIEFAEPTSHWWQSIKKLLADKTTNAQALQNWAQKLTVMSKRTHRVPLTDFQHRISKWENLDVERLIDAPAISV